MSADTTAAPTAAKTTVEQRVANLFGLSGDNWLRHANAWSVWTRFSVLSLLALAVWSRAWIGWYCLIPVALAVTWMMINPLLFPQPRSTRNWASRSVLGERIWLDRRTVELPAQFRSPAPDVANALAGIGLVMLAYGLITSDVLPTIAGVFITNLGKLWYLDRMVLLFEDMKQRNAEYAAWEY
ncbi:MAG TPA: DUF6653 family protein [Pilimelia sp.]|nr:DUF6653 family protein [Pilimelia sp.]